MHTGNPYTLMYNSVIEPELAPVFEQLYMRVQTGLVRAKLAHTPIAPATRATNPPNLETALNLNCGVLATMIESPDHSFSKDYAAEDILTAQLTSHQEALRFLAETGGRYRWTPGRK